MPDQTDRAMTMLLRGAEHVVPDDGLADVLRRADGEGRPLRVKLGVDPSSSDLHVGHAVVLRKMRQFQDAGHRAVLIVGDFTATIGDPTGRNKTRPPLTLDETRAHGRTYVEQATAILDPDPARLEIRHNSEWLEGLGFAELVRLASTYTVARMMERDDFTKRFGSGIPIQVHEFLYPLAQAYDSVAVRADVELGGTDQLFNLLVGRDVQRAYGMDPQVALTTPLLEGLDGKEKMSKSLGNVIGIREEPASMFKKAMQVHDDAFLRYVELCTALDVAAMAEALRSDPVAAHRAFASELVRQYHGDEAIAAAERRYDEVARGAIPDAVREVQVDVAALQGVTPPGAATSGVGPDGVGLLRLLVAVGFASSNGEARRLVQNRGVKLDGEVVTDATMSVTLSTPRIVQRGRDTFVRVVAST